MSESSPLSAETAAYILDSLVESGNRTVTTAQNYLEIKETECCTNAVCAVSNQEPPAV